MQNNVFYAVQVFIFEILKAELIYKNNIDFLVNSILKRDRHVLKT